MRTVVIMMAAMIVAGTVYGQSPRARIGELRGTVEIRSPGSSAWRAAREGEELEAASMVSTGFRSTAQIQVGGSVITVRPLTRLSLEALQAAGANDQVDVRLSTGRVRADVNPTAGRRLDFTVRGPVATASVRGTVFDMDTFNLNVERGMVSFAGANNAAVFVSEGQSSAVSMIAGQTAAPVESAEIQAAPPPAGATDMVAPPQVIPGPVPLAPLDVELQW
ncbi:MAG: FecR family protein [Spirochaetaceae bacterium]|jgi:hypothetical protein|nr:FecR family protein [Spirochaetaceae bacterium]